MSSARVFGGERVTSERKYGKVNLALARALILRRPLEMNNTKVAEMTDTTPGYWYMSHVVSQGWDGATNYTWIARIDPNNKLSYVLSGQTATETGTTRTMANRLRALMYLLGVERENRITMKYNMQTQLGVYHNGKSLYLQREVFAPIGILSLCAVRCALQQDYPDGSDLTK